MTRVAPLHTLSVVLLALLVAGCPEDVELIRVFPGECPAEPVFELLSPNPDGTSEFTDGEMPISVDVGNFAIVAKLGEPAEPCEGHFHVSIDGGAIFMMPAESITRDIHDLADGEHTIRITVHRNDHSRIAEIEAMDATFVTHLETN